MIDWLIKNGVKPAPIIWNEIIIIYMDIPQYKILFVDSILFIINTFLKIYATQLNLDNKQFKNE